MVLPNALACKQRCTKLYKFTEELDILLGYTFVIVHEMDTAVYHFK